MNILRWVNKGRVKVKLSETLVIKRKKEKEETWEPTFINKISVRDQILHDKINHLSIKWNKYDYHITCNTCIIVWTLGFLIVIDTRRETRNSGGFK